MKKSKDIILCGIFSALIAVGAFIRIPIPIVPFTLQTTFTTLAGYLLGARKGAISVLIYILLGLVGFPVFTEGGGISYILKPTFGYLIAFAAATYITGMISHKVNKPSYSGLLIAGFAGLLLVYVIGIAYMYLICNLYMKTDTGIWQLIFSGCVLVLPGNIIMIFLAALVAKRLLPVVNI